jgi:hypothetical protein
MREVRVVGIDVPGMPAGSPGMETGQRVPYEILAWRPSGATFVDARVSADGACGIGCTGRGCRRPELATASA